MDRPKIHFRSFVTNTVSAFVRQCVDAGELEKLACVLTSTSMDDVSLMCRKRVSSTVISQYVKQRIPLSVPTFSLCAKSYIGRAAQDYDFIYRRGLTSRNFNATDLLMLDIYVEQRVERDILSNIIRLPPILG